MLLSDTKFNPKFTVSSSVKALLICNDSKPATDIPTDVILY